MCMTHHGYAVWFTLKQTILDPRLCAFQASLRLQFDEACQPRQWYFQLSWAHKEDARWMHTESQRHISSRRITWHTANPSLPPKKSIPGWNNNTAQLFCWIWYPSSPWLRRITVLKGRKSPAPGQQVLRMQVLAPYFSSSSILYNRKDALPSQSCENMNMGESLAFRSELDIQEKPPAPENVIFILISQHEFKAVIVSEHHLMSWIQQSQGCPEWCPPIPKQKADPWQLENLQITHPENGIVQFFHFIYFIWCGAAIVQAYPLQISSLADKIPGRSW